MVGIGDVIVNKAMVSASKSLISSWGRQTVNKYTYNTMSDNGKCSRRQIMQGERSRGEGVLCSVGRKVLCDGETFEKRAERDEGATTIEIREQKVSHRLGQKSFSSLKDTS